MEEKLIYLDTYTLQQDMRIRLPKSIIGNLDVKKGETEFKILFDKKGGYIVLKPIKHKEGA